MKMRTSTWWMALGVIAVGALLYISQHGIHPRYFDIEWDEEVQLHDGRVIWVHVKRTYERRDRFSRYASATFRRNEFDFDAGSDVGRITFVSRLGVNYIDQVEGEWYAVLVGQGPYGNSPEESPDYWGSDFSVDEKRLAKLVHGRFVAIPWDLAPSGAVLRNNFIVGSIPLEVLASFDNKRLTVEEKVRLRSIYPPAPGGGEIARPARMRKNQEEK